MAEWLKARASKACIPLRVSGVRIPLSPPDFKHKTDAVVQAGKSAFPSSATETGSVRTLPCHRLPVQPKSRFRCFRAQHTLSTDNSLLHLHSCCTKRGRPDFLGHTSHRHSSLFVWFRTPACRAGGRLSEFRPSRHLRAGCALLPLLHTVCSWGYALGVIIFKRPTILSGTLNGISWAFQAAAKSA